MVASGTTKHLKNPALGKIKWLNAGGISATVTDHSRPITFLVVCSLIIFSNTILSIHYSVIS